MTVLAMLCVEFLSRLHFGLIERTEQSDWPCRRVKTGKFLRPGELIFNQMQVLDIDRRTEKFRRIGEIHTSAHAERFTDVPDHGLLNRSVVLHPSKPACKPD